MLEYKYRVEYAHADDTTPEDSGLHHGRGTMEITTPSPIETDEDKYAVAQAIGHHLDKTTIAIQEIIPLDTGHVVIDASDYGEDE